MAKKNENNGSSLLRNESSFYAQVRTVIVEARWYVHKTANIAMVKAYWLVGKMIVEQQGGAAKAAYGDGLVDALAERLTAEFGAGFTRSNLRNMRQFYLCFENCHTLCGELSWSHYRLLITVESEEARQYYAEECRKSLWSVRELQRQINSFYFERLLENRTKRGKKTPVHALVSKKETVPEQVLRDPLVLEFLGLNENAAFQEKDLERLLITHLNYYERELMNHGDNPPIGIVLCMDKGADLVRYTLPLNEKRIFAAKYKIVLPTEEQLLAEIRREQAALEEAALGGQVKKIGKKGRGR